PLVAHSRTLGFELHFFYTVPSKGPVTGVAAALTSSDRLSLLLLSYSEPVNARWPSRPAYSIYSRHADGHLVATSGGFPGLVGAATEIIVLRLRHCTLEQTWDRHSERISADVGRLVPFLSDKVTDAILRILQRNFDYNVSRGVYVPLVEA